MAKVEALWPSTLKVTLAEMFIGMLSHHSHSARSLPCSSATPYRLSCCIPLPCSFRLSSTCSHAAVSQSWQPLQSASLAAPLVRHLSHQGRNHACQHYSGMAWLSNSGSPAGSRPLAAC